MDTKALSEKYGAIFTPYPTQQPTQATISQSVQPTQSVTSTSDSGDINGLAAKYGATFTPTQDISPQINFQQSSDNPEATFPAQKDEMVGNGIVKMIGNIPSSAYNFAKGAVASINPVSAVKNIGDYFSGFQDYTKSLGGDSLQAAINVIKELPGTAYGMLVPKATQQAITGDFSGARETLTNDPIGQILPYLMAARGAAENTGMGAQFDNAISTMAKPITSSVGAVASKVSGAVGAVAKQTLGAATGAGASSVGEAFNHSQAFTDALRGKINPDDVVQTAQDAVANIANSRRADYVSKLQQIGEQKGSLDISPVTDTLQKQLDNFGVTKNADGTLNFSRSSIANNGSARNDIQGVYDTLKTWGTQPGDRTAIGLDTLKKQLGDFYSDSSSARAFVQAVKGQVSGILSDQVPGYSDMTKSYATASSLLDDIKSATSIGGKAKVDTIFTKLTTAMKSDKELRLEVMNELSAKGAQPDLMAKIAGINMQNIIPKGIVGRGVDAYAVLSHFFSPQIIPVLLSTSPRIVGEFIRATGIGAEKASLILNTINNLKLPNSTATLSPKKK